MNATTTEPRTRLPRGQHRKPRLSPWRRAWLALLTITITGRKP